MLDPQAILPELPRPLRRTEYEQLAESGAFEDERVELLRGVIVRMTPPRPPHDATIERLTELFVLRLSSRARVRIQGSFAAGDDSQPQPDIAVVERRDHDDAHPDAAFLIVEVADASLRKDRGAKAEIYAAAGVPEYWVVDVNGKLIEVSTAPADGVYGSVSVYRTGERIRLSAFDDVEVAVDEIVR
jgi:Uma2 family endonuclease